MNENQENTVLNDNNSYQSDVTNQNKNAYAQEIESQLKNNPDDKKTTDTSNTPEKSTSEFERASVKTPEDNFVPKSRESTSFDPRTHSNDADSTDNDTEAIAPKNVKKDEENIQINEISSSSSDFFDVSECESCETTKKEHSKFQTIRNRLGIDTTKEEESSSRITRSKRGNSEVFPSNLKKAKCETAVASTSRTLRERKSVSKEETREVAIVNKRISLQKKKLLRKVLSPKRLKFAYNQMQKKPVFTKKITSTVQVIRNTRKTSKVLPKKNAVRKAVVTPKNKKSVASVSKENEKEDKENMYGKVKNGRTRSSLKLEENISNVKPESSLKVSSSNERKNNNNKGKFFNQFCRFFFGQI